MGENWRWTIHLICTKEIFFYPYKSDQLNLITGGPDQKDNALWHLIRVINNSNAGVVTNGSIRSFMGLTEYTETSDGKIMPMSRTLPFDVVEVHAIVGGNQLHR
ncbi:hypothetical protein RF11_06838 [Thelohanellus kitauei]|uniref:Uncharacterized protein n=1 Tax=Thelohanellus kitauei TaxID=669202 RepID=A0A0C2MW29_THEKT|nr:hypothetical protein RF11_06838 [Thelohanellus kitauei]